PILFEIPGIHFPLRSFGFMVMLGFLVGAHFLTRWGTRGSAQPELAREGYSALPIWVLIGILLGARAMYVVVEILRDSPTGKSYLADPLSMLFVWQGGLVMYGGAIGGILGGLLATRKYRLPLGHAMDLGVTCAFLGLFFGRIGCLLVGDDFGRVVSEAHANLPFPIVVHVPNPLPAGSLFGEENAGKVLYCTQLWMSFQALGLFLLGRFLLLPRRRFAGQVAATLLLLYAGGRYTIENFRGDSIRGLWFEGRFSTSQLISIVVGLLCVLYLALRWSRRQTPEQAGGYTPGQTRA
ncbi:MAG TPA: prolipoprotein diacylglyceryl transferase, partial [Planctomycetota bacterium]|nr:prolipoprotein diacylglyceryl transferase [Planctomycetota bacterium]